MKPILFIQNIKREYPGFIQNVLTEKNIPYKIKMITDCVEDSPKLQDYSALIILGGPTSANDTTPTMLAELELCRTALQMKLPYLGICLGHQVLVKAAGGKVVKGPQREIGWTNSTGQPHQVKLTEAGKQDQLFTGLAETLQVFQLHGEMVEVTPEMTVLATGDICPVQVVRVGDNAYGLQCHFELNDNLYQDWLNEDDDLKVLDRAMMEQTWQQVKTSYQATGKTLIENWTKLLG